MIIDANFCVESAFIDERCEPSPMVLHTTGYYIITPAGGSLSYFESTGEEGLGGYTDVRLMGDVVLVERSGPFASTMHFEKNRLYTFDYHTPYGNMQMSIITRAVRYELDETGGSVYLDYLMNVGGQTCTRNVINITFTAQKCKE